MKNSQFEWEEGLLLHFMFCLKLPSSNACWKLSSVFLVFFVA